MVILYLLLVVIGVLYATLRVREGFLGFLPDAVNVGNPLRGDTLISTQPGGPGQEIYAAAPYTCKHPKTDLQDGLCYEPCRSGYKGVGPVCWAESSNVGTGVLKDCPPGWNNDGLTCREPIRNDCSWKGLFGECWGKLGGGIVLGRADGSMQHGMRCPDSKPDHIDGLCYAKCPAHLPHHMPGMPYLCYTGGDLSYGRGVGDVPSWLRLFGKYGIL